MVLCALVLYDFSKPRPLQGPRLRSMALLKHSSLFCLSLAILFCFLPYFISILLIPKPPTDPFTGQKQCLLPMNSVICTSLETSACHLLAGTIVVYLQYLKYTYAALLPRPWASGEEGKYSYMASFEYSAAHSRGPMLYWTHEWINKNLCKAMNSSS